MAPTREAKSLRRESAGQYRTRDDRYTVLQQSAQWWLSDAERTDELGQPALRGPFASLSEATDAIDAEPQPRKPRRAKTRR
jgi:hypothetical protein